MLVFLFYFEIHLNPVCFCNHLAREEMVGYFTLCNEFYVAVSSYRSLSLHRGAMGWSVVYDCGISWSYSLSPDQDRRS